ncbi:hypothetical protein GUJ93_ZPchr0001g32262 [Zizania palustris]|uniref:Uncharacterized protein n=1 Tax=Zizania palustris TaxID=103762 RepID=A0A8J5RRG4_ZIZPA|nr:hypothetical protein GUJ93_ZPchr0001g32262 [Zizania palustris]
MQDGARRGKRGRRALPKEALVTEATVPWSLTMKLLGGGSGQRRGLARALKEHKARLYIIRRCVVMLLRC